MSSRPPAVPSGGQDPAVAGRAIEVNPELWETLVKQQQREATVGASISFGVAVVAMAALVLGWLNKRRMFSEAEPFLLYFLVLGLVLLISVGGVVVFVMAWVNPDLHVWESGVRR